MTRQSVDDARALGHVFSLAHALQRGAVNMMLLRETATCRAMADELYQLSERNRFPWQLSDAIFFRGWLAVSAGDFAIGLEQMTNALNQKYNPGFRMHIVVSMAEAELLAGQTDRAAATIERATGETQIYNNHFGEPDVFRLRGEILLAQSRDNVAAATQAFREAMAIAARQPCPPLELRAATSLAQLLASENRPDEARDVLAPVYSAFTEGFGFPDLQAAKALLDELR